MRKLTIEISDELARQLNAMANEEREMTIVERIVAERLRELLKEEHLSRRDTSAR